MRLVFSLCAAADEAHAAAAELLLVLLPAAAARSRLVELDVARCLKELASRAQSQLIAAKARPRRSHMPPARHAQPAARFRAGAAGAARLCAARRRPRRRGAARPAQDEPRQADHRCRQAARKVAARFDR